MNIKKIHLTKAVSIIAIIYGFKIFAVNFQYSFFKFSNLPLSIKEAGLQSILISSLYAIILPICFVFGGMQLYQLKQSARKLLIFCFLITITIDLFGLFVGILNDKEFPQIVNGDEISLMKSIFTDNFITFLAIICFVVLLGAREKKREGEGA